MADADANPWDAPAPAVIKPTAPIFLPPPARPRQSDLEAAAEVLNAGSKVAMLVGAGALARPGTRCWRWPKRLASPIIKTLPGKAVVPDDHPLTVGGIGLLGTAPSMDAMEECDTLFMIGTNFPYTKYLPESGASARWCRSRPTRSGPATGSPPTFRDRRRQGNSRRARCPCVPRKSDRSFLGVGTEDDGRVARARWRPSSRSTAIPIQPQRLMAVIDRLAADDAILTSDSGTIATWAARHFTIRGERQFYLSGNLATMAPGLPYTIANQWAHPGRQCIAFVGDGGFAMLMAEFATACRYELPIKVVINNNASLGQIMWEQLVLGYPEYGIRFEHRPDFAPWAQACGGMGIRVDKGDELEGAVAEASGPSGSRRWWM